jgi:hypothetical protein
MENIKHAGIACQGYYFCRVFIFMGGMSISCPRSLVPPPPPTGGVPSVASLFLASLFCAGPRRTG